MMKTQEIKASYRHTVNPETGGSSPLPTWSNEAIETGLLMIDTLFVSLRLIKKTQVNGNHEKNWKERTVSLRERHEIQAMPSWKRRRAGFKEMEDFTVEMSRLITELPAVWYGRSREMIDRLISRP